MSEFVKKTIVGYKDVPGGSSDPDCTHVILTLNEYKKIVRERDEAIRTVGIERQNADRQMNEEKKNAAYQIRQVRDQASERSGGQGNRRNAGSIGAGPEGCSISTAPK